MNQKSRMYHVTVLSNFVRGYDKYARSFSKIGIPESTFPDRFHLLRREELSIGITKAGRLLNKLAIPGNRLIVLECEIDDRDLQPNLETGLGLWIKSHAINLSRLFDLIQNGADWQLRPLVVEDAMAESFRLLHETFRSFSELEPRSFSVLPIAKGCQAACPFCFSEASVSSDQEQAKIDLNRLTTIAELAKKRGAERFVITGGGEPGLLPHSKLFELIALGRKSLGKTVLITNGHHLAKLDPTRRRQALLDYHEAGLRVLAISRHHHDDTMNSRLMNLMSPSADITQTWREHRASWPQLRLRYTCVLQQSGIHDIPGMAEYVSWVTSQDVEEICFKELYVSTSVESVYHQHAANQWSHQNQVPLSLVLEFVRKNQFEEVARLPWGSPVFRGHWQGRPVQIAAYTEPSLLWERTHGIARSWNFMADGRCLVSLEDRASELATECTA